MILNSLTLSRSVSVTNS
uniref:Uncharacterized protein n=1 Tax=Arundo donax TaxID=35708 RepID=A0A0A8ZRL0_ARUDO